MSEFPVVALDQIIGKVKEKIRESKGPRGIWRANITATDVLDWIEGNVLERLLTLSASLHYAVGDLKKYAKGVDGKIGALMTMLQKPSQYNAARLIISGEKKECRAELERLLANFVPPDYAGPEPGKALEAVAK